MKLESFNLKDIKIDPQRGFENLLDLRKMNIGLKELSGAFHVPRDWVLLERTILLLYGCCTLLDPELNPMEIIQPYLQDFVLGNRDWPQIAIEAVRDMALERHHAARGPAEVSHARDARRARGARHAACKKARARSTRRDASSSTRRSAWLAGWAALELHFHGEDDVARWPLGGAIFCGFVLIVSSFFSRPRKS